MTTHLLSNRVGVRVKPKTRELQPNIKIKFAVVYSRDSELICLDPTSTIWAADKLK